MTVICIDDGPTELTGAFLDVLAAQGRKAVFGLVGEKIRGREEVVRRIAAEGHEIANHTMTHARLTELREYEIDSEILRCDEEVRRVTGRATRLLRPPFNASDKRVRGIASAWRHQPLEGSSMGDYLFDGPDELTHASRSYNDFLGLHELPVTLAALPAILEAHPA